MGQVGQLGQAEDLPEVVRTLLGELRALKEKSGYDLRSLERKTHASRSSWGRWLSGETWIPRESVGALADLCGGDRRRLEILWEFADQARRMKGDEAPNRDSAVTTVTDGTGSGLWPPRQGGLFLGAIVMSAVSAAAAGVWLGATFRSQPMAAHPAPSHPVVSGRATHPASTISEISRSQVIAQARTWYPHSPARVPYDQVGTYQGYRMDGSGYASMALGLPKPGPVSSLLATAPYSRRISMTELQPGDLVINPTGDADARQVIIFERWADPGRSSYWAYQQRRGYGTDHLVLRNGLNGSGNFYAFRPRNIRTDPSS